LPKTLQSHLETVGICPKPKKRAKEIRSGGHLGRGVVLDRGAIYTPSKNFEDKEIKTENV